MLSLCSSHAVVERIAPLFVENVLVLHQMKFHHDKLLEDRFDCSKWKVQHTI